MSWNVHELDVPPDLRIEVEPVLALLAPVNDTLHALDAQSAEMAEEESDDGAADQCPRRRPCHGAVLRRDCRSRRPIPRAAPGRGLPRVGAARVEFERMRPTRTDHEGRRQAHPAVARRSRTVCAAPSNPRRYAGIREWADGLATRRGNGIAVVALARRLAGILYALWRDGTRYDQACLQRPVKREAVA